MSSNEEMIGRRDVNDIEAILSVANTDVDAVVHEDRDSARPRQGDDAPNRGDEPPVAHRLLAHLQELRPALQGPSSGLPKRRAGDLDRQDDVEPGLAERTPRAQRADDL